MIYYLKIKNKSKNIEAKNIKDKNKEHSYNCSITIMTNISTIYKEHHLQHLTKYKEHHFQPLTK